MKQLLLPLGLLLSACVSVSDVTTHADPADVRPHVKRPNLLVADLDRSLAIYRDILGFSAGTISDSATDSYSYPVFNIPGEARMRYTYLGEPGEDRVFGLTEVKGIALPRPVDRPHLTTVVIGVTGLDGIMARLDAMGLEMTEPKTTGGTEFRFTEVAFTDPDGHLIVLYEVLG